MMLYTLSGAERSAFDHFGMPRATSVFQPTFKGEGVIRSPDILADERYGHNAPHKGMREGHLLFGAIWQCRSCHALVRFSAAVLRPSGPRPVRGTA